MYGGHFLHTIVDQVIEGELKLFEGQEEYYWLKELSKTKRSKMPKYRQLMNKIEKAMKDYHIEDLF